MLNPIGLNMSANTYPHLRLSPSTFIIAVLLQSLLLLIRESHQMQCDVAKLKCAFRSGCGLSLSSYMMECSDLIAGRTNRCQPRCEQALIGLASSEEGQDLINCECNGSRFCELSKERIEVCRHSVQQALAKDTIVSCNTAKWICLTDSLCSTALEYYHLYCRPLFHERRCTHRCNNSLSILNRQEKAAKLRTCYCDGTEDFPCKRVKYNTERYCFGRHVPNPFKDDDANGHDRSNHISPMAGRNYYLFTSTSGAVSYTTQMLHSFTATLLLCVCSTVLIGVRRLVFYVV